MSRWPPGWTWEHGSDYRELTKLPLNDQSLRLEAIYGRQNPWPGTHVGPAYALLIIDRLYSWAADEGHSGLCLHYALLRTRLLSLRQEPERDAACRARAAGRPRRARTQLGRSW